MKILSEHILMRANSAPWPVSASGTPCALVTSDVVCLYCRLHVEQIKRKHVLVGPDRIKHQWEICEGSEPPLSFNQRKIAGSISAKQNHCR